MLIDSCQLERVRFLPFSGCQEYEEAGSNREPKANIPNRVTSCFLAIQGSRIRPPKHYRKDITVHDLQNVDIGHHTRESFLASLCSRAAASPPPTPASSAAPDIVTLIASPDTRRRTSDPSTKGLLVRDDDDTTPTRNLPMQSCSAKTSFDARGGIVRFAGGGPRGGV